MHEIGLARKLVGLVCDTAAREGAEGVEAVEIEVGLLSGVTSDALRFGLETACRGTMAEGARFELDAVPGRGECQACGREFRLETTMAECPGCGAAGFRVSGGDSLRIRTVTVR